MIPVSCPDCGKSYKLDSALIGKKVRSKVCESTFPVKDSDVSEEVARRSATRSSASSAKPVVRKAKTPKEHASASEDDEFAGLNSVSSDGEALEELPELPAKRKRNSSRRDDDHDDDTPARPKKKRKSKSDGSGFSLAGPLAAIIAACVGGGAGALIWGAIVYFTHYEVGYVAWAVGGLIGFCVRVAAGDMNDTFAGIIAAVGSVFSILAGKVLGAYFIVQWIIKEGQVPADLTANAQGQLVGIAFAHSFSPIDIVFFLLAIATAYKLGAGHSEE